MNFCSFEAAKCMVTDTRSSQRFHESPCWGQGKCGLMYTEVADLNRGSRSPKTPLESYRVVGERIFIPLLHSQTGSNIQGSRLKQDFSHGWPGPDTWTIFLLLCQATSRKLDQNWKSWVANRHPYLMSESQSSGFVHYIHNTGPN